MHIMTAMRQSLASSGRQEVAGLCGVCPGGCGARIFLEDGRITRVVPLKGHPLGMGCPRMACAAEVVYSPDRLLHPLRRSGPRGAGQFERVTWDQAYDHLVQRLRDLADEYGPESICTYTGRGNFELGLCEAFAPEGPPESSANAVLFPFGSPNTTGVGACCYVAQGMIAPFACFGVHRRRMAVEWDRAELLLVWGANPATASPAVNLQRLKEARSRGARVVVIDPRRTGTARATDAEWVPVRPGTDGALALGMIHVLAAEALYDREFVLRWTHGFDELRHYAARFTPEETARITGVPAARVRRLARDIAGAAGCAVQMYTGLEYCNGGVQAVRAVWSLLALAGHLDAPGGNVFRMQPRVRLARNTTPPPADPAPIGRDEHPLYHAIRNEAHAAALPPAILDGEPYPVRGMIISGASLITAWPDPDLWRRALASLDLLVVVNRFPTADAAFADLVLPTTTLFENLSYMVYDDRVIQLREPVIEPLGEARSDIDVFAGLARRLGYGHLFPADEEDAVRRALDGSGLTLEQLRAAPAGLATDLPPMRYHKYRTGGLRADGQPGFETPTGKFELASTWLAQYGLEPLPVYTEPAEGPLATPEVARRFPLVLGTGTCSRYMFRSQHPNIPGLARRQPAPVAQINVADAAARGIADGDEVDVVSPRGRAPFVARVTDDIAPGVVEVTAGGGGPLGPRAWREGNANRLTDLDNRDALSGFPVLKALLCEVELRRG